MPNSLATSVFVAASAAGLVLMGAAGPVRADTCATEAISARGEAAPFEWAAKTKARANWRRRVRATTGLGTPYSDWKRATNTEERCISGPEGTVCVFTGLPCRP